MIIDEKKAGELHENLVETLENWSRQNGVEMTKCGMRYGDGDFNLSLKFDLLNFTGKSEDEIQLERFTSWKKGDEINIFGKNYTIIGFKPRSKRYPLIVRDENGRQGKIDKAVMWNHPDYKFPASLTQTDSKGNKINK